MSHSMFDRYSLLRMLAATFTLSLLLLLWARDASVQPLQAGPSPGPQSAAKNSPTASSSRPTDVKQIAERLMRQSAALEQGEVVIINGRPRDLDLLEELAIQARKSGAFPLITLSTDELERRLFTDVPEKFDSQTPKLDLALAELADVYLCVCSPDSADPTAGVPNIEARNAVRMTANAAVREKVRESSVRYIEAGNDLYPTAWRADRLGMSQEQLSSLFWKGINTDYNQLRARGEALASRLRSGKRLAVRAANGTELTTEITGRRPWISDGSISPQDKKAGGAAVTVYLPAGEVAITPVPGSANGKVVIDRMYYSGRQIERLTLEFRKGTLTSMTGAGPGYSVLKDAYDAVKDQDKAAFAFVDIGLNTDFKLPQTSKVGTWISAGTVTVGLGNNLFAGGDNNSSFGVAGHLPRATVTVDEKPVVQEGKLVL